MWFSLSLPREARADFSNALEDLLRSTSRVLILVTGGTYLLWYLASAFVSYERNTPPFFAVAVVVTLACVVSLRLLGRRFLAAQVVWLLGLAGAIVLALLLFQQAEIVFLLALLPFIAVVLVGWPAGLIVLGAVSVLAWWLSASGLVPTLPVRFAYGVLAGGGITVLLGWTTTRALLTVTQWSLSSFEDARERMEALREQRLELSQVKEDLLQANSELARLSDRLRAMYVIAEEARRAKEEFVANVSHELRTPLNMIIGFSEMITESPQVYGDGLPPALLTDIATIQRNSQHLSRLVDDVLDLSQIEANRMALSKEWVVLPEVIEEAATAVNPLFESKGLFLNIDVALDMPPVFCDGTRVRQVVLNLLSNAGRFTEQGGVRVKVRKADDSDRIVVSVTDTGPGIALEDQAKLFEPFQQLDGSVRRRHGGSGLGLSISKRFVEMHGGEMWMESEVGVGTTIHFSLPSDTLPPDDSRFDDALRWFSPYKRYEPRTRRTRAPAPAPGPRYVLLEQGQTLTRLFSRYLEGAEIAAVNGAEEAIEVLGESPAQALVINLPSAEGPGTILGQLGSLPYGTPAMVCWVAGADDTAQKLGVVRYIVKPVAGQALLSALADLGEGVESVLVVDDEPAVLQLFVRILSQAERPYRILQTTSGQRALSLLRERQPDVMLLDLIMPGMDGFQVLQEKLGDPSIRDIPVIVVTANDPTGEPIVSDTLTVTRGGGLSVPDLMTCIRTISQALSPSSLPGDRAQPGNSAGSPACG